MHKNFLPLGMAFQMQPTGTCILESASEPKPILLHTFPKYAHKQLFPAKSTLNRDVPVSCVPGLLEVQIKTAF